MRVDSTDSWRESLESLVCFYIDELQRDLSGSFADNQLELPPRLANELAERHSRSNKDYFYPIPKHESQRFLFDCMRYIAPKDADTRKLRSLIKAHWMPGGAVYEEGHSGDFFRVERKQPRKTRSSKPRP